MRMQEGVTGQTWNRRIVRADDFRVEWRNGKFVLRMRRGTSLISSRLALSRSTHRPRPIASSSTAGGAVCRPPKRRTNSFLARREIKGEKDAVHSPGQVAVISATPSTSLMNKQHEQRKTSVKRPGTTAHFNDSEINYISALSK